MKLGIPRTALLCAFASAATGSTAWATAATQNFIVRMNTDNGTTTTYVSPTAIRKTEPASHADVIYRLTEGKIIYLDHQKKTYSEVTFAEARQRSASAAASMNSQRKEMMQRMGLGAKPTITKLGAGDSIGGCATEKYLVKTPMMETEISAAPELSVPAAYYEVFILSAGQLIGGLAQMSDAMRVAQIRGMVLKQVTTTTIINKTTLTRVATSVEKGPIAASTFEPPAGYKNVPREF